MKRAIVTADRTAQLSLRLLVLLNVLFFLSFVATALIAAGKAPAEIANSQSAGIALHGDNASGAGLRTIAEIR